MSLKQIEPVVEKVGGRKFYIRPFPAFKAANLTGELASVLAPVLGALAAIIGEDDGKDENGEKKEMSLLDIDAGKAASAISGCTAIDGDKLEKLMQKLLLGGHIATEIEDEDGNVEGARLNEDIANEIFCGEVQDMFILCFHVIKLNFNGFFKRFAILSGKAEDGEEKKTRPIF